MESVGIISFKKRERDSDIDYSKCVICQKSRGHNKTDKVLRTATNAGIVRLKERADERHKYQDVEHIDMVDRIQSLEFNDNHETEIMWHKTCYANFTNPDHIARIKRDYETARKARSEHDSPQNATSIPMTRRSSLAPVEWDKCIFCQCNNSCEKIHNVSVINTSSKMIRLSKKDATMRYRLAGVNDLIASEGKYHLGCYSQFLRKYDSDVNVDDTDISMDPYHIALCNTVDELKPDLLTGKIFSLTDVWDRYCEFLSDFNVDPGTYRSNRFKDKVQTCLGDSVKCVRPLDPKEPLLLFPNIPAHVALQTLKSSLDNINELEECSGFKVPHAVCSSADLDQELLSWLYRAAIKIKADINNIPSQRTIGGLDIEHAESVVPESLFLLLRIMCLGDEALDEGTKRDTDITHAKILRIGQDIVQLAADGRKTTPKHIAMGITVHQATRSKELVQLLHAAGHSVSYESVLRIDASIADAVIQNYHDQGNVFIPSNFVHAKLPGYIRYANDNIDINEETLDSQGTFHASQTAAFRKQVIPEHSPQIPLKPQSNRSITVPPGFIGLKCVNISNKKPAPAFSTKVKLDWFDAEKTLSDHAKAMDLSWILCRMHSAGNQYVPSWTGFNQLSSSTENLKTIVGDLPIINSPAHDYDTIWTVIHNCQKMTSSLQQKYTVVTFDEQLYCKAKILQWTYPDQCANLIILLGGFHIQMNFTKVIGEHMVDSGLKDILIESGVYGENTASNILLGKGWNRVIRAHKLVFEALWRILWPKFLQWASDNDRQVDDSVLNLAAEVSDRLKDDNVDISDLFRELVQNVLSVIETLSEYDSDHSANPTFNYWRQYMSLVSILLRFTRALRTGDWHLHLSTFAEMLPWFAIYDHTHYTRWRTIYLADMRAIEDHAPEVYTAFVSGDFEKLKAVLMVSQMTCA